MTSIEFYFDPSCPFSWITSRWLLQVSREREIDITWRQFSLALKNSEMTKQPDESSHAEAHREAHRVHRIIRQTTEQHAASLIELYSEFGIRHHIMERSFSDEVIREVLEAKNLPFDLLRAAEDVSIDSALEHEITTAIDATGKDIGVPTIVFKDKNGKRLGYFGPVLNALPESIEESLAIWDGISALATSSSFYEIKRARSSGPDVFSAARC